MNVCMLLRCSNKVVNTWLRFAAKVSIKNLQKIPLVATQVGLLFW